MADYNELIRSLKAAAGGFADIARDLAGAAGDKARDLAGGAGEKAKALAKLAKLSMELNSERDSLNEAYAEVGKLYFETADKTAPGEMYVRAFDRVMLSLAAIERMEAELTELRACLNEAGVSDAAFEDIVDAAEAVAADGSFAVEITEDKPEEYPPGAAAREKPPRFPGQGQGNGAALQFWEVRPPSGGRAAQNPPLHFAP